MDSDHSMITLAAGHHPEITFARASLPRLPCTDRSFDAITANFVLNHTPDPRAAVSELFRVTQVGGVLVATISTSEDTALNQLWDGVLKTAEVAPPAGVRLPAKLDSERTAAGFATIIGAAGFGDVDCQEARWTFTVSPDDLWLAVEAGIAVIGRAVAGWISWSLIRSGAPSRRGPMRTDSRSGSPLSRTVIDIDLTVPDVSNEAAYLPLLEAAGFRLIFRDDLGGEPHRQLTFADPNTNVHIWNPGAIEPRRHAFFVGWLRTHPEDRARYAEAKLAAVAPGASKNYNDSKAAVIYDIYERAFAADPVHHHDPHPRESSVERHDEL